MQTSSVLPATALCLVQRWDTDTGEIENGTYFGLIAALTFKGPFEISGVRVSVLPHNRTVLRTMEVVTLRTHLSLTRPASDTVVAVPFSMVSSGMSL